MKYTCQIFLCITNFAFIDQYTISLSLYLAICLSIYTFKKICISKTGIELFFIISSLEVQFSTEHPWPPQACPILPIPPLEVSIPPLGRNIPHFGNPWFRALKGHSPDVLDSIQTGPTC